MKYIITIALLLAVSVPCMSEESTYRTAIKNARTGSFYIKKNLSLAAAQSVSGDTFIFGKVDADSSWYDIPLNELTARGEIARKIGNPVWVFEQYRGYRRPVTRTFSNAVVELTVIFIDGGYGGLDYELRRK